MAHLAIDVVQAFAFLDLSDDDAIDSDVAVNAMEDLTSYLRDSTANERQALHDAAGWHLLGLVLIMLIMERLIMERFQISGPANLKNASFGIGSARSARAAATAIFRLELFSASPPR